MPKIKSPEEHDAEPVMYCANCYSLKIKHEDSINADCCGDCGCSNIQTASIDTWEWLYERRYGKRFIGNNKIQKKVPLYRIPVKELKNRMYESDSWRSIILKIYPDFPGGLSKGDSLILFFAQLDRDDRMNDLRSLLLNYIKV